MRPIMNANFGESSLETEERVTLACVVKERGSGEFRSTSLIASVFAHNIVYSVLCGHKRVAGA